MPVETGEGSVLLTLVLQEQWALFNSKLLQVPGNIETFRLCETIILRRTGRGCLGSVDILSLIPPVVCIECSSVTLHLMDINLARQNSFSPHFEVLRDVFFLLMRK